MPSVRSLILLSGLIFVVSLFAAWLSLFQTPDSDGAGHDTYGTKGYGFRGLYEVLGELDVAVHRRITPPEPTASDKSIVLLQPDQLITGTEPTYLKRLIPWVEQGGRLTVALSHPNLIGQFVSDQSKVSLPTLLESLGLSGVKAEMIETLPVDRDEQKRPRRPMDEVVIDEELNRILGQPAPPARQLKVTTTGEFRSLEVTQLTVPGDQIQILDCGKTPPESVIRFRSTKGIQRILVAAFPRGAGQIVVVADHALFRNRYLTQTDNSILAVRLFSPEGQPVLFDEFYHGLGVRGNPLFLMTRPGYAALLLGLLLISSLMVWREAVLLGPSLLDKPTDRRDISEYLSAMGRFYSKGQGANPFLIQQVRDGVLRDLCSQLSLATETQDIDTISAFLTRRNPAAGERLRTVVADVDAQLKSRIRWTEHETIDALRRLTTCLSTKT